MRRLFLLACALICLGVFLASMVGAASIGDGWVAGMTLLFIVLPACAREARRSRPRSSWRESQAALGRLQARHG